MIKFWRYTEESFTILCVLCDTFSINDRRWSRVYSLFVVYLSSEVMRAAHAYTLLILVLGFHLFGNGLSLPLSLSLCIYIYIHVYISVSVFSCLSLTHTLLDCSKNQGCCDTKFSRNFVFLLSLYLKKFIFGVHITNTNCTKISNSIFIVLFLIGSPYSILPSGYYCLYCNILFLSYFYLTTIKRVRNTFPNYTNSCKWKAWLWNLVHGTFISFGFSFRIRISICIWS